MSPNSKRVLNQTSFVIICLMVLTNRIWSFGPGVDHLPKDDILLDDNSKRYITAVRTEHQQEIDGLLNNPAWEVVQFQGGFTQREPEEGAPATENTEVGVIYDKDNLYFGVKCYDSEADKIISKEMRRDAGLNDDDYFQVLNLDE